MIGYLVRRLLAALGLLAVISIVTYGMFYAGPTDPARLTCGRNCTPQSIADNRHYLGLDKPVLAQYADFVKGLVVERDFPDDPAFAKVNPDKVTHCPAPCLGYSPLENKLVTDMVKERLPVTLSLTAGAFVVWILFGVGCGVLAALRRGQWQDRGLVALALIFFSFPAFFVALLMYNFLATQWHVLPAPGYVPIQQSPLAWAQGLVLPWISLATLFAASYLRLTRAYVLETMGEDYLRTARSKGLPPWKIVLKHNLRSALTPIVTVAGLDLGGLMAGAAITETVFNFQGMGRAAVQAVSVFDLPVIVALVLIAACFVVGANLIVDLVYGLIDPRVRLGAS
ncbi:ABC transporter permease [Kribbella sp. NPDC026611]|uniref:ABC transporter permease n=1 Tax=Kribbella sp. NPDC026611 TaxID=3154911 RepID=UPI0033C5C74C